MANQDELLRQSAKDIVYDVLGHYKGAIPWFTGIYEDWTLGSLRINLISNELTFRSENFSQKDFDNICHEISRKIKRNLSGVYIANFAKFNGEPGRLSVGNLVDAVACIFIENQPEEVKEREPEKISSSYNYMNEQLYRLSSGLDYVPNIYDIEPDSLVELLCQENLLGFSEKESLMASELCERIEILDKDWQDDDVRWTVKSEGLIYSILTDIHIMEIIEFSQILN
jgi:hypothetical protein